MPFSTGNRNCVGSKLFYAEARMILAKLLWNFDLKLSEPEESDWMTNQKSYLVFEPKPLRVEVTERK
jgi:cytochrome P450